MIGRDITERKQAQEILQKNEYKYRRLFENIQEMITIYEVERDDEGRIVELRLIDGNPSFVRTAKYASIDEIRTKTSSEIFGREWADNHLQAIQEAMDRNEVRTQEVHLNESDCYYITTIVPLDANTYIGTGRDITDRKRAEQERERLLGVIQHEKDRLTSLLDNITDEIWFADSQENFTLINPSGRREFGINDDEETNIEKFILNLDIYRFDGSLRPIEQDPALRALHGEIVTGYEHIVRIPTTGELCHRQINSSPVRDQTAI